MNPLLQIVLGTLAVLALVTIFGIVTVAIARTMGPWGIGFAALYAFEIIRTGRVV